MKNNAFSEYVMPPEADQFLDDVMKEFADSFEVKDKYLSGWLKHIIMKPRVSGYAQGLH